MEKQKIPEEKQSSAREKRRVVLVGTYKGDQLTRWRGWYCWPISADDLKCCQCENVANGQSQLPMPNMGKLETGNNGNGSTSTLATLSAVAELWLFKGTAEQKSYKAEFVGIKTREELIRDYGYPAKGKSHGDLYALFKPAQEVA